MKASTNTAAHNLVLVSIGNTNVSLATWANGLRSDADRVPVEPFDTVMEHLQERWDRLPAGVTRTVAVCSVCPPVLARLRSACKSRDIEPVLAVGQEMGLPIDVDVPEPAKVGTDRLCVAAAAFARAKSACVVADIGTAMTIDLVADNGVFLGGTIMPGMALCARALHEHTAQLPLVEIGEPTETLGKDTPGAIRNGIFAMMVGALREITERYATQIGKWPPLILTGGDAPAVAQACEFADGLLPDLCLDGLVIAYQQYAGLDLADAED